MSQSSAAVKMRRCFADILHEHMSQNKDIVVLTADLGYKMWDQIKEDFPGRFMNVGAAEQALMGIAVGMALEGKIPVVYSITPFLLYRPFETVRNYVNNEKIPVKLIGAGRGRDYHHDGFSHWADEDRNILKNFENIKAFWPENNDELPGIIKEMLTEPAPYYLNLKK